jgi:hypothetical protein
MRRRSSFERYLRLPAGSSAGVMSVIRVAGIASGSRLGLLKDD